MNVEIQFEGCFVSELENKPSDRSELLIATSGKIAPLGFICVGCEWFGCECWCLDNVNVGTKLALVVFGALQHNVWFRNFSNEFLSLRVVDY